MQKKNDITEDDELPVRPKDESAEVKQKEKRRSEDNGEEKQEDKRRRLGRLSKGKQWLHWKEQMEEVLSQRETLTLAFPRRMQRGPIMTLYVQDNHEE